MVPIEEICKPEIIQAGRIISKYCSGKDLTAEDLAVYNEARMNYWRLRGIRFHVDGDEKNTVRAMKKSGYKFCVSPNAFF